MATPSPAAGHFFPVVPFLWALRAAGHDVRVVAPSFFAGTVLQAGLPVMVTAPTTEAAVLREGADRQESDLGRSTLSTYRRLARTAEMMLPGVRTIADRWGPHMVVSDPMDYAGRCLAAERGTPHAEHWIGRALAEAPRSEAARDVFGTDAEEWPGIAHNRSLALVDPCPSGFQRTGTPADIRMRYVPYNGPTLVPGWLSRRDGDAPRVLITLGTIVSQSVEAPLLIERAVDAATRLGAEVVVAGDRRTMPPHVTERVRAAQWLPIGPTVEHCDLIVHHGGSGTTMSALVHGVPQVVCPSILDQKDNARGLEETRAGRSVSHAAALHSDALSDAIQRVLGDKTYHHAALALKTQNDAAQSPADAVGQLLRQLDGR